MDSVEFASTEQVEDSDTIAIINGKHITKSDIRTFNSVLTLFLIFIVWVSDN